MKEFIFISFIRLYDFNEFKQGDYLKYIFICSKDNPIRILDGNNKGKILKNYVIRNQVEEIINPVCLKLNEAVNKFYLYINYHRISIFFVEEINLFLE